MAMEITNNYNAYENVYATQKQQTEKKQAASGKETSETVYTQKNSRAGNDKARSTAGYAKELEKFVPSVEFRVGTACVSAQSGKSPYAPTLGKLTKLLSGDFTFFNESIFR